MLKVGASQASLVGIVKDEGSVAKEGADALLGRRVEVEVLGLEGIAGDLAILAAEVSGLARLGSLGVARRLLAASGRVEMGQSLGAVATVDGIDVKVVS